MVGLWAAAIPQLQTRLNLSADLLGLSIFFFGHGAVLFSGYQRGNFKFWKWLATQAVQSDLHQLAYEKCNNKKIQPMGWIFYGLLLTNQICAP